MTLLNGWRDNLKFLNPIQISKLERDKILPNPKNPEDLVFYSKTISKSPQGPQESALIENRVPQNRETRERMRKSRLKKLSNSFFFFFN